MTESDIQKARSRIDHGCDGPITPFVLIERACNDEAMANALYKALVDYGWLIDDGSVVETGS